LKPTETVPRSWFRSLPTGDRNVNGFSADGILAKDSLIFATRHRLGMEKFLKVCWALDPSTGEANYNIDADLAWSGEPLLWSEMNTITKVDLFERSLVEFLRKQSATNVELYGFCLEQGFCASKAKESLQKLQKEGRILVTDTSTGNAARLGSFYLQEKTVRAKFGVQ
jgi:hypothetical protein